MLYKKATCGKEQEERIYRSHLEPPILSTPLLESEVQPTDMRSTPPLLCQGTEPPQPPKYFTGEPECVPCTIDDRCLVNADNGVTGAGNERQERGAREEGIKELMRS